MKKILHILSYCLLLVAIPIVSKAIEFRTLPVIYPQGITSADPSNEYATFKEGVIAWFSDSLHYFNGNEWETYSEYSRKTYGQPGKIVVYNDELFILRYPSINEVGTVYKINSEGKVKKIELKWDEFNSASAFGDERKIRDIDVDNDGNLYIITNFGVIVEDDGNNFKRILQSATELLITNQLGEIIEYRRSLFSLYPSYNTRDTLPNRRFDKIKVTQNGNIYLTGFAGVSLLAPIPFWELSKDGWKSIDIGFNQSISKIFEPISIQELNGNLYVSVHRNGSENPFGGVLFEWKNNDWTSFGFKGADVNVPLNNPYLNLNDPNFNDALRFSEVVELNGELYASTNNLGIMKISKDEFVSYPVITEEEDESKVFAIIKAKNSLWVAIQKIIVYPDFTSYGIQLRLIDPAGLTKSSIEDEAINPREILSVEYYDMIGKLLNESDINTGIPHIKYTKYKDGGFKAQKIVINE